MNNKLFTLLLSVISLSFFQNRVHAAADAASVSTFQHANTVNRLFSDTLASSFLDLRDPKIATTTRLTGLEPNVMLHELPPEIVAQSQEHFSKYPDYKKTIAYLNERGPQLLLRQRNGFHVPIPTLKFPMKITDQELVDAINIMNDTCKELITSIDLYNCNRITDNGVQALAACKNLLSLNLSYCDQITDSSFITYLTQLKSLDLSGCKNLIHLSPLSNLAKLQSLRLFNCDQIRNFSFLASLTNLQSLDLSCCFKITDISPLLFCKQLQSLNLSNCKEINDFSNLASLTQLKSLNLSYCDQIRNFTFLASLTNLQSLDLADCEIMSISFLAHFIQLKSLDIFWCNFIRTSDVKSFHNQRTILNLPPVEIKR